MSHLEGYVTFSKVCHTFKGIITIKYVCHSFVGESHFKKMSNLQRNVTLSNVFPDPKNKYVTLSRVERKRVFD